jgi:hypothetical protein
MGLGSVVECCMYLADPKMYMHHGFTQRWVAARRGAKMQKIHFVDKVAASGEEKT